MTDLNLPKYDLKKKFGDAGWEIWDPTRKKFICLTPEEWVRQNFLMYLTQDLGFPVSLVNTERGLKYNNRQKRSDIIAYNNELVPVLLVECKAPEVSINQKVFEQVSVYNQEIKALFLVVTNGLIHFCCKQDFSTGKVEFLEEIPSYSQFSEE